MKAGLKAVLAVAILGVSAIVQAQTQPGYDVSWGIAGVPLSPWMHVTMAALLGLGAMAFLRKRHSGGLFCLAAAVLVGALSLGVDEVAVAGAPSDPVAGSAGSMSITCNRLHRLTRIGGIPVTLTVTPVSAPTPGAPGECTTGTVLHEGETCTLCASLG